MADSRNLSTYTFRPCRMRHRRCVVASEPMWRKPIWWNRVASHESRCRCSCSFPHMPHDWCDGNPKGEVFERPRVLLTCDMFEDWQGTLADAQGNSIFADGPRWSSVFEKVRGSKPVAMQDVCDRLLSLINATPSLDWLVYQSYD